MTLPMNPIAHTTVAVPVLWSQKAAAEYLGVSQKWLERDRWVGPTIPYAKVGRGVRYRASDVVAYLNGNMSGTQAA